MKDPMLEQDQEKTFEIQTEESISFFDLPEYEQTKTQLVAKITRQRLEMSRLQRELARRQRNPWLYAVKETFRKVAAIL